MDGLAAFRYVLARARNSVAAREESGTGDQKQNDESCHAVPLRKVLDAGSGCQPDTHGYREPIGASADTLHM